MDKPGKRRGKDKRKRSPFSFIKQYFKSHYQLPEKEVLRKQLLIILASLVLSAVFFLKSSMNAELKNGNILERNEQTGGVRDYKLEVRGIKEEAVPVELKLLPLRYTREEAEKIFDEIYEGIEHEIIKEGQSLDAVSSDLKLPEGFPKYGIAASWSYEPNWEDTEKDYSKYRYLIHEDGKVDNEDFEEGEAVEGRLKLVLSCDIVPDAEHPQYLKRSYYSRPYSLYVRVVARSYSREETLLRALDKELLRRNEEGLKQKELRLPEEILGQQIRFSFPKDYRYLWIPLLGIIASAVLYFQNIEEKKEEKKKRETELLADYAELVSKLNVYLGAGLTVRNALLEISRHFDAQLAKGNSREHYLHQELRIIREQLKENIPESMVYQEFSERIGLRPYTKLMSLIEQNRKNGSKDLRHLLRLEMTDAFEIRKNTARRLGEESGTKLLLPLLIQLGIVMIIVLVPALSFL